MRSFTLVAVAVAVAVLLVCTTSACGNSIAGTTWTGTVALTSVTVSFDSGGQYTSDHFGNGAYAVSGDQVTLTPSGQGTTRVFVLNGSLMQGTVDGWSCTLTKQ